MRLAQPEATGVPAQPARAAVVARRRAVAVRPCLAGIDLVDARRVGADLDRWADALPRRLLGAAEAIVVAERLTGPMAHRVATCFAVKESAVKAIGGRPPGFRWQDISLGEPDDRLSLRCPSIASVAGVLEAGGQSAVVHLSGATHGAARDRLQREAPGSVDLVAVSCVWGVVDGHVLAAVAVCGRRHSGGGS